MAIEDRESRNKMRDAKKEYVEASLPSVTNPINAPTPSAKVSN